MSKTNAIKVGAIIAIVGGAIYLAVRGRQPRPLAIGDGAPEFSVPAVPSGSLDLKIYRGQVLVLNLWATWCPPCVEETPSLEQFAQKMRDEGVMVVSLSVDEDLPRAAGLHRRITIFPTPLGETLTGRCRLALARFNSPKLTFSTAAACWRTR